MSTLSLLLGFLEDSILLLLRLDVWSFLLDYDDYKEEKEESSYSPSLSLKS